MAQDPLLAKVMEAFARVNDPELHRDLVSLGMVENVRIEDGVVSALINLTTPACPLKDRINEDARAAVLAVPGVRDLRIEWGAQVRRSVAATENLIPGVRNTVVVGSGKGGVGKSTVAANLALALAADGASVGLMDADIYGPNQPTMLGVSGHPSGVDGKIRPFDAPGGLRMISIGFFLRKDEPVIWRGPMLHGAMRQFLGDVAWGDLDYLIIDLPPGTGDIHLTLSQIVPLSGAVLVTTPQAVALEDMRKAALMFHKVNVPLLGIVENMSGYTCRHCGEVEYLFGRGGGKAAAEEFGIPFLGEVPLDPRVMTGGDSGRPVILHDPDSPAARALRGIARALAGQLSIQSFAAAEPVAASKPRLPQPISS
jgi:ATP-binding protein involved in chromosome partitioning